MSNRSRGAAFEVRIKKYLESLGFTVDKARAALHFRGPGKFFSSQNDFFGCADLIAIHPEKPYILFIQATLGEISSRKKKLLAVPWNLQVCRVQLWKRDEAFRGGIVVKELGREGSFREIIFRIKDGES